MADDFVGLEIDDEDFLGAVGAYYDEFKQIEDEEVIEILNSGYPHPSRNNLKYEG